VTPGTSPTSTLARLAVPGLVDVACADADCLALAAGTLHALPSGTAVPSPPGLDAYDTLRAVPGGWEVEGPCPTGRCAATLHVSPPALDAPRPAPLLPLAEADVPSLSAAGDVFASAWNVAIHAGWRSGFTRVLVGPGGGRITWLRGIDGAGQLIRAGAGARTVRIGATTSPVSFPGWLALHPTGTEAYLVAWPSPWVKAFDPASLASRWTLPLDGAAQGLFLDAKGRWLLVGEGPSGTDRFADWDLAAAEATPTADPARDEAVRALDRPPMDATVVIDLASHTVAARAAGRFRRWIDLGDHLLLATDREIVTFPPGDLPR
jgi:hypothetical protein